ncbi:MAG: CbiX/SirB N-terminal domain-containing protein [Rhodocyclaceae bacterium]|jgi:sirohydrochlorin cobaltochelatase|nr:CbiX/SirB N-terminal domain-containing protein [Rhodocyclaceae bacterium]MDP2108094.1 CbiX/SirB N-terminal domain-containing protein [Rhodocyclaceae bacterium]MDP2194948.1 CbiX/SirB N-terminal domain-containing protein [Rhodocyclaceae bacterium]
MKGIILFGHGARNPEYIEPFRRIRAVVEARQPEVPVEIGFLELTQPPLETSIECLAARGVNEIRVVPIFFAPGRHVLKDLPELIANALERFPGISITVAACVGEVGNVIDAMAEHAIQPE